MTVRCTSQRASATASRMRFGVAVRGLLLPLALLAAWQAFGMLAGNVRTPLPTRVVGAALTLIASGDLLAGIAQSLGRVFRGFAVAALIAIPLGLAMGAFRASSATSIRWSRASGRSPRSRSCRSRSCGSAPAQRPP